MFNTGDVDSKSNLLKKIENLNTNKIFMYI